MSTNTIIARGGVEFVPPISLAFWRWFTVFIILFPIFYKEIFDNGLEIEESDPLSKLSVYAKNNWPAEPKNFSKIVLSYYERSIKMSKNILREVSKTINHDYKYFDDKFMPTRKQTIENVFR